MFHIQTNFYTNISIKLYKRKKKFKKIPSMFLTLGSLHYDTDRLLESRIYLLQKYWIFAFPIVRIQLYLNAAFRGHVFQYGKCHSGDFLKAISEFHIWRPKFTWNGTEIFISEMLDILHEHHQSKLQNTTHEKGKKRFWERKYPSPILFQMSNVQLDRTV